MHMQKHSAALRGAVALGILAGCLSWSASAQTLDEALPAPLARAAKQMNIGLSNMSISVKALDGTNKTVLSVNAADPVSPASTEKLVTTLAALELLGPNYHWLTDFYIDQDPDQQGHIKNLYLKGSGDPSLVIEQFQLEVDRLAAHGISHIDGDFVVDRSLFDLPPGDTSDFDGKGNCPYNQFPDAALVNYNSMSFEFVPVPGKSIAHIDTLPPLAGIAVPREIPLGDKPCGNWQKEVGLRFKVLENGQKAVTFEGVFPKDCDARVFSIVSMDKNEFLERVFRALWEKDGRTWSGHVVDGKVPDSAKKVLTHASQPLREVVALANKWSNNQIARHLFLTTSKVATGRGSDAPYDLPTSRTMIMRWLQSVGVNTSGWVLDNGSGLSRESRVTADGMTQMLIRGWVSPYMSEYMSSLPISGIDGTMRKRKAATTFAHIKTGYLANVRAIGGYVQTESGKRYAVFAQIEGGKSVWQGIPFLDRVIEWVHDQE